MKRTPRKQVCTGYHIPQQELDRLVNAWKALEAFGGLLERHDELRLDLLLEPHWVAVAQVTEEVLRRHDEGGAA